MKTTKRSKEFTELIDALVDLSDKDFKAAIRIARQYRRAGKSLTKAIERQQKEFMLPKKQTNNQTSELSYEFAS